MSLNWPSNPSPGDIYTSPRGLKWKYNGKGWISFNIQRNDDRINSIIYSFSHDYMNPSDSIDYYIGSVLDLPTQSSISNRVVSLVSGRAKRVAVMTQIGDNLGSDEDQTFILCNLTKETYSTISSSYKHLKNSQLDIFNLSNYLDISVNDELVIIWKVPVFSNSPRLVKHNFDVYIE